MDVGSRNGWELGQVVPAAELARRLDEALGIEPLERGYRGEVAERWRYKDGSGELGIIASVTRPFCGDCTRARLTTDGKLVTCLFATGGIDLRAPLRAGASDEALRATIEAVWRRRTDRYSELRTQATEPLRARSKKIEMYQLGG
jgi:cyclic pyranopterin phosphate synthase